MSGTSMDGVDGAILRTDGEAVIEPVWSGFHPYSDAERAVAPGGARPLAAKTETPVDARPGRWWKTPILP